MDRSAKMVLGAMVAAMGFAVGPAQAVNISLVNGGFETGTFAGWTGTGNTAFNGVQCPGPGPTVAAGNCSAFFGPVGSLGSLSQSFATTVGQPINISLAWLTDGGTPSEFSVELDPGTANFRTLLDSVNHGATSVFLTPTLHATAQLPIPPNKRTTTARPRSSTGGSGSS